MNRMEYFQLKQFADEIVGDRSKVKLAISYALSVVLYSACGQPVAPVSPLLVCLLFVMAVLLYRARGNVAAFLRVDWERPWSGVERRRG